MELIGKLDGGLPTFKYKSGCKPTCNLQRLEITDEKIGPLPAHGVLGVPDLTLSATQTERWQHQHLFLRSILIRNEHLDYGIYIDATWAKQAKQEQGDGSSEEIPLNAWFKDLWDVNFYIGRDYTPYTFGMVKVPYSEGTSGKHYDHKYEVYSPYIRNNKYNGGEMHYHNASRDIKKALKLVQQRIRAPLTEERHLYEINAVLEHQKNAATQRGTVKTNYASTVSSYQNREDVLTELVAMRMHSTHPDHKVHPYEFQNDDLANTIDAYIKETKELGEAIDPALENSECVQRVHIITGGSSGRKYFSRTAIQIKDWQIHDVYGDTVNAAYRPVESMPEDVANKIATLDLVNKEGVDNRSDCNWILNVGVMVNKGELYYLPITAKELVESPGVV